MTAAPAGVILRAWDPITGYDYGYFASVDIEGGDGRGAFAFTTDPARAMRWPSASDALADWRAQCSSVPLRPDGKPNRPMTAFTVEIIPAAEISA